MNRLATTIAAVTITVFAVAFPARAATITGTPICNDFGGLGAFGCRVVSQQVIGETVENGSLSIEVEIADMQHIELIDSDADFERIAVAVHVTNSGATNAPAIMNIALTDENGQVINPFGFVSAPFTFPPGFSGLVAFGANVHIEDVSPIVYHGLLLNVDVTGGPLTFGRFVQANIFEVDQASNVGDWEGGSQPPSPPILAITKTLENGPRVDDGGVLVELTGLTAGSNDAGPIDVGRTDAQFYEFAIEISKIGGGDSEGVIVSDVIPAEYDLDPQCGRDLVDVTACDLAQTGDVDRDDDGVADGIINETPASCVVRTSTSGGGTKKNGDKNEPEFIDIVLTADFDTDGVCRVRGFVHTDASPGNGLYNPAGCREFDGGIFDTIALNAGVKAFDPVTGDRLLGPVGSLQLTPNNCE